MTYVHGPPVVVGYDGSVTSRAALMVAAGEAVRRDRGLVIVHALETTRDQHREGTRRDPVAQALLLVGPLIARNRVAVDDRLGAPAEVLVVQAGHAELLVVGRGEPGLLGRFAGSVTIDVVCAAACPVIVVAEPGPHVDHGGPVVAGIDHHSGDVVLEAAFREADLRGGDLIVLHTWSPLSGLGPDNSESIALDHRQQHAQWLRSILAPYRTKYPNVLVAGAPGAGRAATQPAHSGDSASLLVVGTRGRGSVSGLLLGPVAQTLVRHAWCPVMLVRELQIPAHRQ